MFVIIGRMLHGDSRIYKKCRIILRRMGWISSCQGGTLLTCILGEVVYRCAGPGCPDQRSGEH